MNFIGEIGNLTLPQIQDYLSGKKPFPGGPMALTAHMPALAAQAVRMKMKDGGEVPQIDKRMQALLMQQFFDGGPVKGKYGYVIAYDVNGKEIGLRKNTDPPFTEEARATPAGMYRASSEMTNPSDFRGAPTRVQAFGIKSMAPPPIAEPEDMSIRPEQRGGAMARTVVNTFNTGPAPKAPDFAPYKKSLDAYEKELGAQNEATNMERLKKAMNIKDRSAERLEGLEALKAGLEQDREMGKWMALAQFASGMAGKRNIAEGLAGGIERGIPAFAASQAAYRKGMGEAADKKIRIEDAADLMNRELGAKVVDMTDKQKSELRGVAKDRLNLTNAEFEAAFKIWKEQNDVAKDKAYIAAYAGRGGDKDGLNAYQLAQIRNMAIDNMKAIPEYQIANSSSDPAKRARAQELLRLEEQRLLAQAGVSGTIPPTTPMRDLSRWSVTPGNK